VTPAPPVQQWIELVEADAPSEDPLAQLTTAATTAAELDQARDDLLTVFVERARAAGRSWSEISAALGVTKQAAHRRFSMSDTAQISRLTPRAQAVMAKGPVIAASFNHPAVGTEHFVLAIFDDPHSLAAVVLAEHGITREAVETATLVVTPRGAAAVDGVLPLTPRAVTAAKGSLTVALELGHNYIGTEHQLLALVRDPEAVAARILAAHGLSADDLREQVVATVNRIYAAKST
jgi:hypothetical protein